MSVKLRMRIAFGLFVGLVLLVAISNSIFLQKIDTAVVELTDNVLPLQTSAQELGDKVTLFRVQEASHILSLAPQDMDARESDMRALRKGIDELTAKLNARELTAEEKRSLDAFTQDWAKYLSINAQLLPISRQFTSHEAIAFLDQATDIYNKASASVYAQAKGALGGFLDEVGKRDDIAAANADSAASLALTIGCAIAAIAAAICIGIAIYFERAILAQLLGIGAAMSEVSKGNMATDIPGVGRHDEVGAMAEALSVFRNGMKEADALRRDSEAQKIKAEEDQRRAMQALADDFERSVNGIVQSVSRSAEEMKQHAMTLTSAAQDANDRATAVAAASEETSANVTTVASATEELSSSIMEITRQVAGASQTASAAAQEAKSTDVTVTNMAEAAKRIEAIIKLISDVASQTNLLALNATIEAARAGEAGKGFAVVANEVKNLATQSGKASEEIAEQISSVQAIASKAVQAIRGITETVDKINTISSSIAGAVEEQSAATKEISRNVQEVSSASHAVSSNITGVTQAAAKTGEVAADVNEAAGLLADEASKLKTQVSAFIARVRAA